MAKRGHSLPPQLLQDTPLRTQSQCKRCTVVRVYTLHTYTVGLLDKYGKMLLLATVARRFFFSELGWQVVPSILKHHSLLHRSPALRLQPNIKSFDSAVLLCASLRCFCAWLSLLASLPCRRFGSSAAGLPRRPLRSGRLQAVDGSRWFPPVQLVLGGSAGHIAILNIPTPPSVTK